MTGRTESGISVLMRMRLLSRVGRRPAPQPACADPNGATVRTYVDTREVEHCLRDGVDDDRVWVEGVLAARRTGSVPERHCLDPRMGGQHAGIARYHWR